MARNQRLIPVSPERVFAVLSDPDAYGHWVVGSDTIRDADAAWPAVGSRFHHRVGIGPLKVNDHTEVLAMEPARRLELHAKARPLGTAKVALDLERRGGGTMVTMVEDPGDPLTRLLFNPITHFLVRRRNDESLRRLERLATSS
jgi:uncharacterized protein YndB with AHSA1/START domain